MKDQIEQLINKHEFTDFGSYGESVIKFNDRYSETNISKVYIDYSDKVFENFEEAMSKQKEIVENDFYKANGSLQWNFYYYFVFNKENYEKIKSSPVVKAIESDTSFARKKIISIELLESIYPFSSIVDEVNSKKTTYSDLSNEWIKILKENDLDEVYSDDKDATYDKVISRFIEGSPKKDEDAGGGLERTFEVSSPSSIKTINLKDYRSFPKNKSFDFSNVNLIEGVNGKGKTSILEAIELLMCGKTYRHENSEQADISLIYKSSNVEEKYEPRNTKKFQEREQFWYGIPATHNKNTLHKNFNRFNFFNTDASYRFSHSDEADIIWKSFQALALGGKTAELGKKIDGYEGRFQAGHRRAMKDRDDLKKEIDQLVIDKEKISKSSEIIKLNYDIINKFLSKIGSTSKIEIDVESSLSQVNNLLAKCINKIDSILERFPTEQFLSIQLIEKKYENCLKLESSIQHSIKELQVINKQISDLSEKSKAIDKRENLIKRFSRYVNHEFAFKIRSIEESLLSLAQFNSKNFDILKSVSELDTLPGIFDTESIIARIKNCEIKLNDLAQNKELIDLKIKASREKFESLKGVILEIKTLGRRFLSLSMSHDCPLCSTTLDRKTLEEKISTIDLEEDDLAQVLEQKNSLDVQVKNISEELLSLKKINLVIRELNDFSNVMSIGEAKDLVKSEKQNLEKSISKYNEQNKNIQHLSDQGFSSEEFIFLAGGLGFSLDHERSEILSGLDLAVVDISSQRNKLKEEMDIIEKQKIKIRKIFQAEFPQFNFNSFDSEEVESAYKEINKIKAGYEDFKILKEDLPLISRDVPLNDLNVELKNYSEDILNYIAFMAKIKQETATLKQLDLLIESKTKLHDELKIKFLRYDKAVNVFEKIRIEHGVDEAVDKFFNQNKGMIVNIFKAIHSPNEFEDLVISNQKIYVIKSGVERELNTISTGQRTAVALSIFLGMHLSCPMAPKIILLDDPIAFVDDLNVLAVLDFLREIVIKGNRQLFFATANKKLANLFKRKFDLLPSSLTVITPNAND